MVYLIACLGLLVLIIATHQAAYSQDAKPTFRVEINVTAEETIKSEIASCLNRELRSFSDIVLTDSEPHIRISVVAVTNAFPNGYAKGYTLSVVVSKPIPKSFTNLLLSGYSGKEKSARLILLKDQESITNHFVRVGSDLPHICKQVIADIDSDDIEVDRKEYQKALDVLRKGSEKKPQQ